MDLKKRFKSVAFWLLMGIGGLAVAAGACWLVWQGMQQVPPNGARLWALLATVFLPLTAVTSWWFGHTEARGRLQGIDDAVDTVLGAMVKTARTRARAEREAQMPVEEIPLPEIQEKRLPQRNDVIEL